MELSRQPSHMTIYLTVTRVTASAVLDSDWQTRTRKSDLSAVWMFDGIYIYQLLSGSPPLSLQSYSIQVGPNISLTRKLFEMPLIFKLVKNYNYLHWPRRIIFYHDFRYPWWVQLASRSVLRWLSLWVVDSEDKYLHDVPALRDCSAVWSRHRPWSPSSKIFLALTSSFHFVIV